MDNKAKKGCRQLNAAEIHQALADRWSFVLESLGIEAKYLRNRHGPCPACGGTDRYRFDNRRGRGDFYCNGCGSGDGFTLLQRVYGWSFSQTRQAVIEAAGLGAVTPRALPVLSTLEGADLVPVKPSARVRKLLRDSGPVHAVPDAVQYLSNRRLWPLPRGCSLRAHAAAAYWHEGRRIGQFPALVAQVVNVEGELITAHVTYLNRGHKLKDYPSRKLLGPLVGHQGCVIRLLPIAGRVAGVAEGIETALAAAVLHEGLPTWAAISASLLAQWQPPHDIDRLSIFADRDDAGMQAGRRLAEKLDSRISVEVRTPAAPAKDWADVLQAGGGS